MALPMAVSLCHILCYYLPHAQYGFVMYVYMNVEIYVYINKFIQFAMSCTLSYRYYTVFLCIWLRNTILLHDTLYDQWAWSDQECSIKCQPVKVGTGVRDSHRCETRCAGRTCCCVKSMPGVLDTFLAQTVKIFALQKSINQKNSFKSWHQPGYFSQYTW